jgi:hypothetical protein
VIWPKSFDEMPADGAQLSRMLFLAGSSFIVLYASLLVIQTAGLFLTVNLNDAATWLAVTLTLVY